MSIYGYFSGAKIFSKTFFKTFFEKILWKKFFFEFSKNWFSKLQ